MSIFNDSRFQNLLKPLPYIDEESKEILEESKIPNIKLETPTTEDQVEKPVEGIFNDPRFGGRELLVPLRIGADDENN